MKKVIVAFALLGVAVSYAVEPVVCTLAVTNTVATSTLDAGLASGAGECPWPAGSTVLMQCTVDVYASSTTPIDTRVPTVATSGSQVIQFTTNSDPYIFYLDPSDKTVSILSVSGSGSCKFMTSKRRKPY